MLDVGQNNKKMSLGLMLAVSRLAVLCMCSCEPAKDNAAVKVQSISVRRCGLKYTGYSVVVFSNTSSKIRGKKRKNIRFSV